MVAAVVDSHFIGHLRIQKSFTSAGTSHARHFLHRRSLAFIGHLAASRTGVGFLTPHGLTVHVRVRRLPGPSPLSCTEGHTGCQRPWPLQPGRLLSPAAPSAPRAPPTAVNGCPRGAPRTRSPARARTHPGEETGRGGSDLGGVPPGKDGEAGAAPRLSSLSRQHRQAFRNRCGEGESGRQGRGARRTARPRLRSRPVPFS